MSVTSTKPNTYVSVSGYASTSGQYGAISVTWLGSGMLTKPSVALSVQRLVAEVLRYAV